MMGNDSSNYKRKYNNVEEPLEKHSKKQKTHSVSFPTLSPSNYTPPSQENKEHTSKSTVSDGDSLDWSVREGGSTTESRESRLDKVANLISALNDVLHAGESLGEDDLLDEESVEASLNLRNLLQRRISKRQTHDVRPSMFPRQNSADQTNIAQSMATNTIRPWTSSAVPASLPSLPEVLDPTLEAGVFIHQGNTSGNIGDLSYERLEWVGDAYLYLTATLLISQSFPALLPGKCSQLRERLVKNVTLAGYAREYGFEKRAKLRTMPFGGNKHSLKESDNTKILGDIFEAYIAAIILSDPVHGVARCSEWLKALWGMTLQKEILAQEQQGQKIDSPLWRLRGNAEPVKVTASRSEHTLNAKDKLRASVASKGINLTYRDAGPVRKHPETGLPLFTIGVYLDGWGEKDKQLGFGSAYGKKEAGMKAAEMALGKTKLIKMYAEKKRLHDAQLQLEIKALEESGS